MKQRRHAQYLAAMAAAVCGADPADLLSEDKQGVYFDLTDPGTQRKIREARIRRAMGDSALDPTSHSTERGQSAEQE